MRADSPGLRDECLNETLFTILAQARTVLAEWREDYEPSGHKTLKEVTRYTAAVDRRRLAHMAMQKAKKGTSSGKPH